MTTWRDVERVVAVIPARGGSKRVPRKNIVDFEGKPLIAWTIEAARESALFQQVVVSTDSPEIAETARQYGADVPFLRIGAADDMSPVSSATIHTLHQLQERGQTFDTVVQLMPVCPLRTAIDIRNAYAHYRASGADFQISCHRYVAMNPWWAVKLDQHGRPTPIFENTRIRSQDLPTLYCPTGAVWIASTRRLVEEGTFYGSGHVFWEIDWKRAIDIDTDEDLTLAQVLRRVNR